MSLGKFIQNTPPMQDWENLSQHSGLASVMGDVVLDIHNKKVKIKKGNIKDIAKGMSEIAYSLGLTNDEDEFGDELEEDIREALKLVKKRLKARK